MIHSGVARRRRQLRRKIRETVVLRRYAASLSAVTLSAVTLSAATLSAATPGAASPRGADADTDASSPGAET